MQKRLWAMAVGFLAFFGSAQAAVTEQNFLMGSTGDLATLCSTPQSDPLYTPAVNFCQGFAVGVFRVLNEQDSARRTGRLICPPNPPPPRNDAIAAFVQWATADSTRLSQPAQDGLAAFFAQAYPCARTR